MQVNLDSVKVKPTGGAIRLSGKLELPLGWKINGLAPMGYFVEAVADEGAIDRTKLPRQLTKLAEPSTTFEITVPVDGVGDDVLQVGLNFFYCQEGGEGLCKVGSVVWNVPLTVDEAAAAASIPLVHKVTE